MVNKGVSDFQPLTRSNLPLGHPNWYKKCRSAFRAVTSSKGRAMHVWIEFIGGCFNGAEFQLPTPLENRIVFVSPTKPGHVVVYDLSQVDKIRPIYVFAAEPRLFRTTSKVVPIATTLKVG
jgi:hypothetical protein